MADAPWQRIKGDGSDALPLDTWYDARTRDGRVQTGCRVTPLCTRIPTFVHTGGDWDVMEVRVYSPKLQSPVRG